MKTLKSAFHYRRALVVGIVVAIVSMMVIDKSAPLAIDTLRYSWFGDAWNTFLIPGIIVLGLPSIVLFGPIGTVLTWLIPDLTFAGFIDSGPIDRYFFGFFSIVLGLAYGFVIEALWVAAQKMRISNK